MLEVLKCKEIGPCESELIKYYKCNDENFKTHIRRRFVLILIITNEPGRLEHVVVSLLVDGVEHGLRRFQVEWVVRLKLKSRFLIGQKLSSSVNRRGDFFGKLRFFAKF